MNTRAITKKAARELAAGRPKKAIQLTRQVMATGDVPAELMDIHARACLAVNNLAEAIKTTEMVIQAGGSTLERALFLGDLLLRARRWQTAANIFQQILAERDDNVSAWLGLGHCLLGSGEAERASRAYSAVLERHPDHREGTLYLALSLSQQGHARTAKKLLEQLLDQGHDDEEVRAHYGETLLRSGSMDEAIVRLEPFRDHPVFGETARRLLAYAYANTQMPDKAVELLGPLLEKFPEDPELLGIQIRLLNVQGRQEEAETQLAALLERVPYNAGLWEQWMDMRTEPLSPARLSVLREQLDVASRQQDKGMEAGFHFALSRHYSLAREPVEELAHLREANALKAEVHPHDPVTHEQRVRESREHYTAERIEALSTGQRFADFHPVFILCPPRSGSTLLEQALARHSAFSAAGEAPCAEDAWTALTGNRVVTAKPELHAELTPDKVLAFTEAYLESLHGYGVEGRGWMIHKGINNHKFAGLLKAAFPNARFIDLRRDPMDVAFGCFRQHFVSQPFSSTFEGCAAELSLFQANMEWWTTQMPGAVRRVSYEELVEDFEGELRALLSWLELPWEEQCLDASRTGTVVTASINQVRRGVNKQGVGRWKAYGEGLAPLMQALERAGVES